MPISVNTPGGTVLIHGDNFSDETTVEFPQAASDGGGSNDSAEHRQTLRQAVRAQFPWIPDTLLDMVVQEWIELGDFDLAMARVRQTEQHAELFPGFSREDGTFRFRNEAEYLATRNAMEGELARYGIPPDTFADRIPELIRGDVTVDEWRNRLATLFTEVASQSTEIRQAFAEEFGIDPNSLSLSSIFASAIDNNDSPVVFEERIRRAQITGEGAIAGFTVPATEAARLAEFGFTQEAARSFFSNARSALPTLGTLVQRHNDPDDDFTLDEFADAVVFGDPDQQERISRLFGQEASLFTPTALFQVRAGALPGLEPI